MLTVHHLGVSQSERIVWLCEELGIPYDLKLYERRADNRMAPDEYKALHPMGIAPVITDGDVILGESAAIMDYIIAKYGDGRLALTKDDPAFADYLFWYHFANGTMLPSGSTAMYMSILGVAPDTPIGTALMSRTNKAHAIVEARLGEVPYFAGDQFTAADIIMVFGLTTMRVFAPRDLTPFPNIRAYLARIGERPAYRRAMAKGDPTMTPMLS